MRLQVKIKYLRSIYFESQNILISSESHLKVSLTSLEVNLKRNKEELDTSKSSLRDHKQAHIERR